jgi:replicative DNA helicase
MTEPITEHDLRSDDAERALLGSLTVGARQLADVLARLPGSDFYSPHRGYVWDACRRLSEQRQPIEPTRIGRQLATDGHWNAATQAIVSGEFLTGSDPTFAAQHADMVANLARRRELLRAIRRAEITARDHPGEVSEVLAAVRVQFDALGTTLNEGHPGTLDWDALVAEFRDTHNPDAEVPAKPPIPTPWPSLNGLLGGLFPGRMYVIGGRPAIGKSAAALCIAADAAIVQTRPTLVISREMPTVDIMGRIFARATDTSLSAINSRQMTPQMLRDIDAYVAKVGRPPLTVDAKVNTLAGVKALARAQAHEFGLDLLVVDYLQLIHAGEGTRNREQEVARVSRELKGLAMDLSCAVVVPAQLNRGSVNRADPRPVMSDLRESGQIEQDADVVVLLHREPDETGGPVGEIEFILAKHRHGPTQTVVLDWVGSIGQIA